MKDLVNYQILKYKYKTNLDFRKNIIKRVMCKHDYHFYRLPNSANINMLTSSARKEAEICSKCGKIKSFVNVYW